MRQTERRGGEPRGGEAPCQPGEVPVERESARVRFPEGELIVTDGPFTEAKELVLSSR
jgi:hypothetical protein